MAAGFLSRPITTEFGSGQGNEVMNEDWCRVWCWGVGLKSSTKEAEAGEISSSRVLQAVQWNRSKRKEPPLPHPNLRCEPVALGQLGLKGPGGQTSMSNRLSTLWKSQG